MENNIVLPCPPHCSIVHTGLTRYIHDDIGTVTGIEPILRCMPDMEEQVIRLYKLGGNSKSVLQPSCVAPGVNTHAVHEYNVQSGYCLPDERTEEERARESERTSISRSLKVVRELAACNPWTYFATITLSPEHWDRQKPDTLQQAIKEVAKRWTRKNKKGECKCPGYKYLFVPERHKDGSIHLHGLVMGLPVTMLKQYTMADVHGDKPLPLYICNAVRNEETLYHCPDWDSRFGYNLIEPIRDLDRVATYIIKYISKDLGKCPFASRYWCSRGLARAKLVAKYYIAEESPYKLPQRIRQYCTYMKQHAIRTQKGAMYSESYRPALCRGQATESQKLISVTAYIDNNIYPLTNLIQYLYTTYEKEPCKKKKTFFFEMASINAHNAKDWRIKHRDKHYA